MIHFLFFIFLTLMTPIWCGYAAESVHSVEVYTQLANSIKKHHASHLTECNCMKAFYRNLFDLPNQSARYKYDAIVAREGMRVTAGKKTVEVLILGSGKLLNELTSCANLLAQKKHLKVYLMDYSYIFYGHNDFSHTIAHYLQKPSNIPENWKSFSFWEKFQDKEKLINYFNDYHRAITQFKAVITDVAQYYGVEVDVEILNPKKNPPFHLPQLDMILSIDSFINVSSLIWNLFYQIHIDREKPIRFISLNKTTPFGTFYDSKDPLMHESDSLHSVLIEIFDVEANSKQGYYRLIETIPLKPTDSQLKDAPEFKTDPNRSPSQSPFDLTHACQLDCN